MTTCIRRSLSLLAALGLLTLGTALPAAAKMFTIDANNNNLNDLDGSDDLQFQFRSSTRSGTGGSRLVSGEIRAVDVTAAQASIEAMVDSYVDLATGQPAVAPDFGTLDIFIFDVVLFAGSALVDEIGVGITTNPFGLDPIGAGFLLGCDPGLPDGCAHNVPGGGETPDDIDLASGLGFFPGATLFEFDELARNDHRRQASDGNLAGGETTRRLFVAWDDTGPQTPLSKDGQVAFFKIGSGKRNIFLLSAIVPEPGTGLLLGLGLCVLAARPSWRRRLSL